MFTISAAGHRPQHITVNRRVPDGLPIKLFYLAQGWLKRRAANQPVTVISGMALGWDIAVAEAAVSLGVPLICAIPFPNQPSFWTPYQIQAWKEIKDQAKEVHIISKEHNPAAFQLRNEWMVDRADQVLALWSGKKRGGTWNCLQYAALRGKPVTNLWDKLMEQF